jgi:hypothetical protein
MTLYQLQQLFSVERHGTMIAFGKLETFGKEAIMAYFQALLRHLLGGTVENHRKVLIVGVPVQLPNTGQSLYSSNRFTHCMPSFNLELDKGGFVC